MSGVAPPRKLANVTIPSKKRGLNENTNGSSNAKRVASAASVPLSATSSSSAMKNVPVNMKATVESITSMFTLPSLSTAMGTTTSSSSGTMGAGTGGRSTRKRSTRKRNTRKRSTRRR